MSKALLFSYLPTLLGCQSADFDGANDYMARGAELTGIADSKSGIFSCWIRLDGGDGNLTAIFNLVTALGGNSVRFSVLKPVTTNTFRVAGINAAGTTILLMTTNTAYTAGATWRHILASWDLAAAAGHLYINDVDDLAAGPTLTDDTIDYTVPDSGAGATPDGGSKVDGCLAELYFAPGQFLAFSTESNRRKFITADGKPAFLGANGYLPTGTAPIVYFHVALGGALTTFATNRATGGNYSITGTLTAGSTSPSD